ncbi:DUF5666 domain-containing protein [Antrihabitans cavernicola]|uniref:DUF5666 domain-containing protein n=1 Tax=Antrihabitans cavernicola TaxID=2495913 RepID=A0A5A7S385_9NOCA|nr:DUF5666 domain-containing protein [Spelaeibacter cavernicola]KAA0018958.1 hypothetical protein FOY51_23255 [Spelaeibacter cavernicola]
MSNPDDPRTEKFDRPTDQFGRPIEPDQPTEIYHTADPYQAYGQQPPPNATMAFPTYQTYDPNQPPPNPTQAYPTYQGGYQQQYQQQPYQQQPQDQPWGGYPGEVRPLEQTQEPKRKSKMWLGILAGLVVLALAGVIAFVATGGSPESSTTASGGSTSTQALPPTTTAAPRTSPRASQSPESSGVQLPPALGNAIQDFGATVGSISANDGSTLTVDGIGGSPVTVHTNDQTQVVAMSGSKVSDLKVGDSVVIQGDKADDGSITARIIISTSLPNPNGFGR